MMKAYLLSLNPEAKVSQQWDYGFLKDFLEGNLWKPCGWEDFIIRETDFLPGDDRAIVVIPARHHVDLMGSLNHELQKIKHCVLFLLGDEEAVFPIKQIQHSDIKIWVQNPHPDIHDNYDRIGTSYPPQANDILPTLDPNKRIDVFFSGQITHQRRKNMAKAFKYYKNKKRQILINETDGFTKGMPPEQYYRSMVSARIAPAPAGAVIPDSFRLYEALECMCVPIADECNSSGTITEYWDWLFNKITPFPKIKDWDTVGDVVDHIIDHYPKNLHEITAWWINEKREFAYKVIKQLKGDR